MNHGPNDEFTQIYEEIMNAARSGQITNQLFAEWYQLIRVPGLNQEPDIEHEDLIAANLE